MRLFCKRMDKYCRIMVGRMMLYCNNDFFDPQRKIVLRRVHISEDKLTARHKRSVLPLQMETFVPSVVSSMDTLDEITRRWCSMR